MAVEVRLPASKLLVYRMPAKPAQVWATSGVALMLLLVFITALFHRTELFQTQQLPQREVFVAISGVMLVMADWIIAILLVAQARVLHTRALYVLAVGYFFAGLFMSLRILSLPGAMGALEHRYDPTYNVPLWFYLSSHLALPFAIIPYAWLMQAADRSLRPSQHRPPGRHLVRSLIVAGSAVLVLTASTTALSWSSPIFLMATAVMLLIIAGMAALGRGLHSELDLWLLLMLWGWFLEMALIALSSTGYTAGWYAARGLGLVSGLFVLFALLAETSKLYAQSVLQLIAQTQEREHRFLIRDVLSASIAHELRNPLAAILINAQTARKTAFGEKARPEEETKEVLDDIVASCLRANDILESTRAMFGRGNSERRLVDPHLILRSTLAMVASSARVQGVSTDLVMEGRPGQIAINPLQFQQALLNLFQNAIEALSHSNERRRILLVRCSRWEDRGVVIRVEDNGPGIAAADRNRIFDAFFTTSPEGLGMGLVIARSVIRAHGGRLDVEPRSPAGTAFVIHLPYGEEHPGGSVPG
jgi:signal transduction histidine kinase